ncbi:MAG: hypothetical protein WA840_05675 [Caulobacteraceae bacterium]
MEGARFTGRRLSLGDGERGRWARWLEPVALGLVGVAVIITIAMTAQVVLTGYVDVPFWDQWGYVNDGSLWSQPFKHHNEHLIVAAKVFYTIDALLGGRQIFNMGSSLAIQVGAAAALALMARLGGLRGRQTALAFLVSLCFTLSTCQYDNFTWGFQVQFVMVFAAFSAGALFAVLYARTERLLWLALSIAAALVSVCSMANGLLAAPLLSVLFFVMGRQNAGRAMLGAAVLGGVLYAIGPFAPNPGWQQSMALGNRFLAGVPFGLTYLGGPFAWFFQGGGAGATVRAARIDGVFVGLLALAGLVAAGLGPKPGREARLGLAAVILFGLLSGAATAYGRAPLGSEEALAIRYATPVMTIVAASLLSVWLVLRGRYPNGRSAQALMIVAAAGLVVFSIKGREALRPATNLRLEREGGMLALAAGAPDVPLLSRVAYAPQTAVQQSADLRRHRRSVFSERWAQALGGPLSAIAPEGIGGVCEGTVSAGQPLYQGTVWAPPSQHPTRVLLLADRTGRVAGVGRVRAGLKDLLSGGIRRQRQLVDWIGVASPDAGIQPLTAYLLIDGGHKACRVAEAAAPVPLATVVFDPPGRVPLELAGSDRTGVFAPSGANPEPGPAPDGVSYDGSWGGADANTGRLVARYRLPSHGISAVVLPVVTGPIPIGQNVLFRLQPGGEIIGAADLRSAKRWTWVRLALPDGAAGRTLEVEAQDQGVGWGEWIAVGRAFGQGTPGPAR